MIGTLIVVAKEPVPGRVKTRLVPPLTHEQAAEVALAAIVDTLRSMSCVPARRHLLALDGRAGSWLPRGWDAVGQAVGGLDARLIGAFGHADHRHPAVLVGMDTPQLRPEQVLAFQPDRYDACLGLAEDGGYWAIGLRSPRRARSIIAGVPMSTAHTGTEQLRRLRAAGMRTQLLTELADVDTFAVARRVARRAPHGEFAALMRRLVPAYA